MLLRVLPKVCYDHVEKSKSFQHSTLNFIEHEAHCRPGQHHGVAAKPDRERDPKSGNSRERTLSYELNKP